MKYFSIFDIITAVSTSFVLGIIFASLYLSFERIFYSTLKLLYTPIWIIKSDFPINKSEVLARANEEITPSDKRILKNILDCLIFLFFALCYILLIYIVLDGIFRLYTLFFLILGYLIGSKSIALYSKKILGYIYFALEVCFIYILYSLIHPLRFVISKIINTLNYVITPIRRKFILHRSFSLCKTKQKNIAEFLKKNFQ